MKGPILKALCGAAVLQTKISQIGVTSILYLSSNWILNIIVGTLFWMFFLWLVIFIFSIEFVGYISRRIFVWSVMDIRGSWRSADICVFIMLGLFYYVCCFNDSDSWSSDGRYSHRHAKISVNCYCRSISVINRVFAAQGLSWGLFSWSVVVGVLSIPELIFVMIMTTQYWVR